MLSAKPQLNLQSAREYFREHLCTGDYYSVGRKVTGEWIGRGAELLGLRGVVKESDFLALCEGRNPASGKRLTARMNSRRDDAGRMVANRRVFYDFTLSPPKSVSVVGLLQDDRILALHDRAVRETLRELEKFAETRVRKAGADADRHTGNVVAATFQHDTSRELDPHLHTHCVVFNATFDAAESRWKALQVQGMFRAQKFAENYYYHELSKGLRSLGYEIENNSRDFEIKGVSRAVVARFSKRHEQIDAETRKRIAREGLRGDLNAVRRQVAEEKRKRKIKNSTADSLRPLWREQLSRDEAKALGQFKPTPPGFRQKAEVAAVVAWADEHLFERRSVVNDFELMAVALARGRGQDFDLATLRDAINQRGYLHEQETSKITSREVLGWELEVVVAAHDGRNRHGALSPGFQPSQSLSGEQKRAVERILGSRDFITLFRGGAGTGKSFTLQEVERGLRAANRPIVVLAPQRQQVGDLRAAGLPAETVALFLEKRELPRGAVVVVDEAGQIGAKQLAQLLRVVQAREGRVILSGDTRQHGAVAASDALRAIEKHAGLRPAVIQQIRRQEPKLGASAKERGFIRSYRAAVRAAAKGKIVESFNRLDRLECIREVGTGERRDALAAEYRAAAKRGEKTLVVAQTRDEARQVNEAVREQLRAAGKLGVGVTLSTLQPVDLGEAQKRDARFYQPGQHACFLRGYGRFERGDAAKIVAANDTGLVLLKEGRESVVNFRYADRFVVAAASEMKVATGDRLQLKFNGKSVEGAPLNNGELVTVRRVKKNGAIVVKGDDGARKTLSPSQRVFVRGYAVTSYGSQGKTVDTVIFADAANRAATSSEQWYVTMSRARKRVVVFTSDKEALRANVQRVGGRELALDLKTEISPSMVMRAADWTRRSLAALERIRLHKAVVERVHAPSNTQRIRL
jgi:conjugative relaxase-like TrwC/TraI family protein